MDISETLKLDLWLRHADAYELQGIDEYTAVDVRLAWAPSPSVEVSAVGRNLGAGSHVEFISELNDLVPVQIEPEAYLEVRGRRATGHASPEFRQIRAPGAPIHHRVSKV